MSKSSFRTISEEDYPDYEIYTCPVCGHEQILSGVGGDVAGCPNCIRNEYESESYEDDRREKLLKKHLKKR